MSSLLPGRRVVGVAFLIVCAAVLAISPLAPSDSASAITITGASSLAETVRIGRPLIDGATTDIHVLGFNDLHGHLDGTTPGNQYGRPAGGAAALAGLLNQRQTRYGRRWLTVAAGDSIGGTPLTSSLFEDEPTILAENAMRLDFASVGNHEFDRGKDHLLRMQNGGCPAVGCTGAPYPDGRDTFSRTFAGANFQYLAANVLAADGKPFLPAYGTKQFVTTTGNRVKVGVIGAVLEATPTIVTPSGVAGLKFIKESTGANAAAKALLADGVKTNILVIHEGGFQTPAPSGTNTCGGALQGSAIAKIAEELDPSIRVIVSGHTHAEYRCILSFPGGRDVLITSSSSFGRILTDITLTVDDLTGELVTATAENVIVENTGANAILNAEASTIATYYGRLAAPRANRIIGKVFGDMPAGNAGPNGEVPLGDVIADAQLNATKGTQKAQIAFMNPGGIRAPGFVFANSPAGEAPGDITYSEAFTVQPFSNSLVTMTLTGAQLRAMLEQQFTGCRGQAVTRILQPSVGFSYEQKPTATACADKIGKITLDGKEIGAGDSIRVTVNSFLATGGDGFVVLNDGKDRVGGDVDLDALIAWFAANPAGLRPGTADRIKLVG